MTTAANINTGRVVKKIRSRRHVDDIRRGTAGALTVVAVAIRAESSSKRATCSSNIVFFDFFVPSWFRS